MTTATIAVVIALLGATPVSPDKPPPAPVNEALVLVKGGTFEMGDVLEEGVRFATPVHEVTMADFYLGRHEVTVERFATFVKQTGHITTAERESAEATDKDDGYGGRLSSRGCWVLDADTGQAWGSEATWKDPQYPQSAKDPVTCVSWQDAAAYCNWLSTGEALAVAYDIVTCDLLDAEGRPTTDVTKVKGYRLPTEAEWEYAAREGGKKLRFGNGRDVARPDEMNFNAAMGEFDYAVKGTCRKCTTPVGSFKPNGLGLYDMSGNLWEWCSDLVGQYSEAPVTNPYQTKGLMGPRRAARGGPWVGGADLARVSARMGWVANDRCNNIGFRVARSK